MKRRIAQVIQSAFHFIGLHVHRLHGIPTDCSPEEAAIIKAVRPYTATSTERVVSLVRATEYIVRQSIPGAVMECGVWRGGSMMAVAMVLKRLKEDGRDLYLFDTFAGMAQPGVHDGIGVESNWRSLQQKNHNSWCYSPLEEVQINLHSTGYPAEHLHLIRGRVEETVPKSAPEQIALLRLDTDWYESTRHELEHLFPRLVSGGILIVDDYGHWAGCKKAVDEYFSGKPFFINRIDETGRLLIKP